jgi:UDP-glucose 4-epimerase
MKKKKQKEILITGGFGNLGSWISLDLIKSKFAVTILGRTKKKSKDINAKFVFCDLTDIENTKKTLANTNFDVVIHLSSYNEFFETNYFENALNINTKGTYNLIQALAANPPKQFVYFSTFHVYGTTEGKVDENTICNPKNDYASTHLFAEYIVRQYCTNFNIDYTIVRLSNSYGCPIFSDSSKWYLVLNDLAKSAFENNSINIKTNGKAKRDFIWMGDVVNVVKKMILNKAVYNNTYNLSSSKTFSVIDIAKAVQKAYVDMYKKTVPISINKLDKTIYPTLSVSNKKLQKVLPYKAKNSFINEAKKLFVMLTSKNK